MKIALAQCNPIVGDIDGNIQLIEDALKTVASDVDLVVFPECAVTGYPPKDLLYYDDFLDQIDSSLAYLCKLSEQYSFGFLVGTPLRDGDVLRNAAIIYDQGAKVGTTYKTHFPDYDVFHESRYFTSVESIHPIRFREKKLGVLICEDVWTISNYDHSDVPREKHDLVGDLISQGAELIITISASPFEVNKHHIRRDLFQSITRRFKVPIYFANQVGANDDLIFDGASMALDAVGTVLIQSRPFISEINDSIIYDNSVSSHEQMIQALTVGIKDYVHKSGFQKVLVGLSGGIDSAVTVALAVLALGKENVSGVTMPSMYSSKGSVDDSYDIAANLGISIQTLSIESIYNEYERILNPSFNGLPKNLAEENIQARIRGDLLMALSNKFNSLVLTTGNKSELAVGYCTLYGDMSGALAVLADVYKTDVYEIARCLNKERNIIPVSTIEKLPSAELRPDQTDQDSLPDYEVLDEILKLYIENKYSARAIVAKGFDKTIVNKVLSLVRINEYKRFQAPLGLKLSSTAFGSGRRFPIVAKSPFSMV